MLRTFLIKLNPLTQSRAQDKGDSGGGATGKTEAWKVPVKSMSSPKTTGITGGPILPNEEIRPTAVNGVAALSKPLLNPVFCPALPHRGRTAVRAAITHWNTSRHEGRLLKLFYGSQPAEEMEDKFFILKY
jgi:hypothetical protein